MTRGVGGLIQVADYNNIRDKMVLVMGTGANGYGQTDLVSSAATVNQVITEANWDALRADLLRARQHQTGVDESANLTNVTTASQVTESVFNQYDLFANAATTDRLTIATNQGTAESLISTTLASKFNTILYHKIVVTFANALAAKYFFNAGGQIRFSAYRSGTAVNTKDTEWTNILGTGTVGTGFGTAFMNYTQTGTVAGTNASGRIGTGSNTGFYDLTTTGQQIFIANAAAGSYSANDYNVSARVNTGFGSGTEPTQIAFLVRFQDDAGPNPNIDEQVTGTKGSVFQIFRPTGSNVSLPAPTAVQTTLSTTVRTLADMSV
jgi:hypothetical protein